MSGWVPEVHESFTLANYLTTDEMSLVPFPPSTSFALLDEGDVAYFRALPLAERAAFVRAAVRAAITERCPPGAILPGLVTVARAYGRRT